MSTIITIDLDEVTEHLSGTPETKGEYLAAVVRTVNSREGSRALGKLADAIEAALPKPEPTGRAAVAVDRHGDVWVRHDDDAEPWRNNEGEWSSWAEMDRPVRVEFEGIAR